MNISAVCRTCLSAVDLTPIFNNVRLAQQHSRHLYTLAGVKIEPNDGLPQNMCAQCVNHITNCFKFRKKCENVENQLKLKIGYTQINEESKLKIEIDGYNLDFQMQSKNEVYDSFDSEEDKPLIHFVTKSKVEMVPAEKQEETKADNPVSKESDLDLKQKSDKENLCEDEMVPDETQEETKAENPVNKESHLDLEQKSVKKNLRVNCEFCNKNISKFSVNFHIKRYHAGADIRKVKCELCDTFILKTNVMKHTISMHGTQPFRCKFCKSEYETTEQLVQHVGTCTFKKTRKPSLTSRELIECDVCHKLMQKGSLKKHKAVKHEGLGPVCEHCGLRLGNKLRLSEHCRAKHGYEKLRCSFCDFQGAGRVALWNHERRHRGEKPFVCEACGARFHAAYLLAQHRQSHRTDKLAKCDQCPARFKANNSLHAHRLACHSRARFRCPRCARAFRSRPYAARHVRRVHRVVGPIPDILRDDDCD